MVKKDAVKVLRQTSFAALLEKNFEDRLPRSCCICNLGPTGHHHSIEIFAIPGTGIMSKLGH